LRFASGSSTGSIFLTPPEPDFDPVSAFPAGGFLLVVPPLSLFVVLPVFVGAGVYGVVGVVVGGADGSSGVGGGTTGSGTATGGGSTGVGAGSGSAAASTVGSTCV